MSEFDKEVEDVCFICGRRENQTGKMFRLPNHISVCNDCMHKTMETVSQVDYENILNNPYFAGQNMPNIPFPQNSNNDNKKEDSRHKDGGHKNTGLNDEEDSEQKELLSTNEDEPKKEDQDNPDQENEPVVPENFPGGMPGGMRGFPNISFLNLSDLQGMGLLQGKQKVKKKKPGEKTIPNINLKDVPPPHKIKEQLDEFIIGQEHAKKVVSVAVYNHYKRVATDTMEEIAIEKSNMLMIGPTGCGKTYLVKTLAKLLDVPLAIADATSLTEAGYIGDDIESVVSKLLAAADNDVEKAERGIIFIDEIDKIAKKPNSHTRDVSGESVQQGMLKLLEGADIEVPVGSNSKNAMVPLTTVNTKNILFICGGAFPDLEEIIKQRLSKQTSIGYTADLKDKYDKEKNILEKVKVDDIKKYGMIPEFIGRLPIIFTLEALTEEMLVRILNEPKNAILKQYQKLLELDEVKLEFAPEALNAIAKKAIEKETGARALRSIIEELMLDIMYEIPKDENIGRVIITKEYVEGKGGPIIEIRSNLSQIKELPMRDNVIVVTDEKPYHEGINS